MKKLIVLSATLLLLLAATVSVFAQEDTDDTALSGTPEDICAAVAPAPEPETRTYAEPEQVIDPLVDYHAIFCTPYGPVYVDLLEDVAPQTVNNFVFLAQNDFYNNLTFHRVIDDFMVQGGDPQGNGTGGPGYQFEDEFVTFMTFDRPGLLAMANSGPNTNGSQFFITTAITDWLNYNHTIFGEVIAGQPNAEAIPATEVEPNVALEAVVIITEPENVEVDYEAPEAPTQEQYVESVDEVPELNNLELNAEMTNAFDTEAVVAALPEAAQEAAAAWFGDYSHQYTVGVSHTNPDCNFEVIPVEAVSYDIHVFDTPEGARAAAQDERLQTVLTGDNEAEPVTMAFSGLEGFTWAAESACDTEVTRAVIYRQLGRTLLVTSAVYPNDSEFDANILDSLNIDLYEAVFFEELRTEVSQ